MLTIIINFFWHIFYKFKIPYVFLYIHFIIYDSFFDLISLLLFSYLLFGSAHRLYYRTLAAEATSADPNQVSGPKLGTQEHISQE